MPNKPNPKTQCHHRSQLNRRCHMPIAPTHPDLCAYHARAEAKAETASSAQAVAAELLTGTENLTQPASVNLFLANLLKNFANHRISRRDATTLAYISQLLLNSQCVMHRQAQDAQAAKAQAAASEPERIVLNIPRPCHRRHLDDPPSSRSGESSDSHLSSTSSIHTPTLATAAPTSATQQKNTPSAPNQANVAPTPATTPPGPTPNTTNTLPTPEDPAPSTHPKAIPLPRWGEQQFTTGTYRETERPNTYGPPRMFAPVVLVSASLPPRRHRRHWHQAISRAQALEKHDVLKGIATTERRRRIALTPETAAYTRRRVETRHLRRTNSMARRCWG
jgi:hypothetical protein